MGRRYGEAFIRVVQTLQPVRIIDAGCRSPSESREREGDWRTVIRGGGAARVEGEGGGWWYMGVWGWLAMTKTPRASQEQDKTGVGSFGRGTSRGTTGGSLKNICMRSQIELNLTKHGVTVKDSDNDRKNPEREAGR
ncbi:hypothetical protein BaRGS_00030351, partial [Batillaria attramentaria]